MFVPYKVLQLLSEATVECGTIQMFPPYIYCTYSAGLLAVWGGGGQVHGVVYIAKLQSFPGG